MPSRSALLFRIWIGLSIAALLAFGLKLYAFAYFWTDDFNNLYWMQQTSGAQVLGYLVNPLSSTFRPLGMAVYWALLNCCDLHPVAYHGVAWFLHAINTCLVYLLLRRMVRSDLGAAVGTALFAFQGVFGEIYWSFGTIFEILCGFLFWSALLLYRSMRPSVWRAVLMLVMFVLALKAKELAITLPVILLLQPKESVEPASPDSGRELLLTAPLFLFAIWFYFSKAAGLSTVDASHPYFMDFSIAELFRGFGWYLHELINGSLPYGVLCVLVLVIAIHNNVRLAGFFLGYSAITFLPVIFLANHRFGFYWYLPFLGVSGIAALAVKEMADRFTARVSHRTAIVTGALLFPLFCRESYFVQKNAGAAERIQFRAASASFRAFVSGLRALRPPERDEVVYFQAMPPNFDPQILLSATQVALHRTDVVVEWTPTFPDDATYRVSFEDGKLISNIRPYQEVHDHYALKVSNTDVVAGQDSYTVSIHGLHHGTRVTIRYTLNGGPEETFTIIADSKGQQVLPVSADTPKGVYRFSAFSIGNSEEWIDCGATILVR